MSDHRNNLTALLARTLPAFPPSDRYHAIGIMGKPAPKRDVLLAMPDDIRKVDGAIQVRREAVGPEWKPVPAEVTVHPIGTPLPFELCDIVFVLVSSWANTMAVDPMDTQGHHVLPGEIARVDMLEFIRRSEDSMGKKPALVGVA